MSTARATGIFPAGAVPASACGQTLRGARTALGGLSRLTLRALSLAALVAVGADARAQDMGVTVMRPMTSVSVSTAGSYVMHLDLSAIGIDAAHRRVIFASSLGTVFEWYDFYLYGTLAIFFVRPPRRPLR